MIPIDPTHALNFLTPPTTPAPEPIPPVTIPAADTNTFERVPPRNTFSGDAPADAGVDPPAPRAPDEAFRSEMASILADPRLTVEDRVVLLLILISKEMDRRIDEQTQHVSDLQLGHGTDGEPAAIDEEVVKLKRLVEKRQQLFDELRQIVDKYNQTAKAIIDSLGR